MFILLSSSYMRAKHLFLHNVDIFSFFSVIFTSTIGPPSSAGPNWISLLIFHLPFRNVCWIFLLLLLYLNKTAFLNIFVSPDQFPPPRFISSRPYVFCLLSASFPFLSPLPLVHARLLSSILHSSQLLSSSPPPPPPT